MEKLKQNLKRNMYFKIKKKTNSTNLFNSNYLRNKFNDEQKRKKNAKYIK